VLAGNYLVFCVPPVRISAFPVLLQLKAFADAMSWKPELGSEIIVIDRHTLQVVSRIEAEPWYQWHFGNGCALPDGSVMLSIARYEDFQTNDRLREISFGQTQTPAIATLWQLQIDPKAGKVLEFASVLDRSCEFPVVQPHQVGQPWRYTYLTVHAASTDTTREVYDTIARFDAQTGNLTTANMGKNHYPTEALYAPDTENSEQGWLLTIVYDSNTNQSEAWIYAADRLDDDPVCRLLLPEIIPLGFHGTWKPA
jgi:carotenoid cleavage dioxygenase-like enzyme